MPETAQTVGQEAGELYALPLGDFTRERDARAAGLRKAGDRDLAAQVRGLRRPTAAAWAVNQLVRAHPDELEQLFELGAALREAQDALAGDELRALNRQQHQVVAALRQQAEGLAADAGQRLSDTVGRQVEGTLRAGMADPDAAAAIRTGLLVTELESTGFDPVDLTGAVALDDGERPVPRPGRAATRRPAGTRRRAEAPSTVEAAADEAEQGDEARRAAEEQRAEGARQVEEARRAEEARLAAERDAATARLGEAETAREAARAALTSAEAAERAEHEKQDDLATQVAELRARLEALERENDDVSAAVAEATTRRDAADRAAAEADEAVRRAQAAVDALAKD